MQCKDIPEAPILAFLEQIKSKTDPCVNHWATWFKGYENSVQNAMPPGVTEKLALAKMRKMILKGLVDGCACGCRGDFTLKGEKWQN